MNIFHSKAYVITIGLILIITLIYITMGAQQQTIQTFHLDVNSQFKTKNMELIEITIDSKSTMFNLGSRNQLANKFIYGIKIFNAYGVSPTGKVNANNITPFMQKAFITIQDSNGTIKIKDLPVSSCWDATGNPMYIEKMKINFEKSYFKLPSLLLTNANAEIPSNTVVMLEIYYE